MASSFKNGVDGSTYLRRKSSLYPVALGPWRVRRDGGPTWPRFIFNLSGSFPRNTPGALRVGFARRVRRTDLIFPKRHGAIYNVN